MLHARIYFVRFLQPLAQLRVNLFFFEILGEKFGSWQHSTLHDFDRMLSPRLTTEIWTKKPLLVFSLDRSATFLLAQLGTGAYLAALSGVFNGVAKTATSTVLGGRYFKHVFRLVQHVDTTKLGKNFLGADRHATNSN